VAVRKRDRLAPLGVQGFARLGDVSDRIRGDSDHVVACTVQLTGDDDLDPVFGKLVELGPIYIN